jgi:hypothetical protein
MNTTENETTYLHFNVPEQVAKAYLKQLRAHIAAVQEAGRKLGLPEEQLRLHDQSKFSREEFYGYAMHLFGGGAPQAFAQAWLHHQNTNQHHWEYWIMRTEHSKLPGITENLILPMPYNYVLEMVADWQGASYVYTGSWDMGEWLTQNMPKIRVHSETAKALREVLDGLGYWDIVHDLRFASEPQYNADHG